MIITKRGRPRRVTDAQYRAIREWRPLNQLAREFKLSASTIRGIREGYRYKQVSP